VVSFLQPLQQKLCTHFSSPHSRYMPRPSHLPWFRCANRWRVQIMGLLIVEFSPASCTSSLLGLDILFLTGLCQNTLSVCVIQ
jgi:hypothetical protein